MAAAAGAPPRRPRPAAPQLQQPDAAPDRPHEPRRRPRARRPEQRVRHGSAAGRRRQRRAAPERRGDRRRRRPARSPSAAARRPPSRPARSRSAIRSSLAVPAFADLAIDIFLPGDTAASPSPLTTHNGALQTSYVSATGNHAGATRLAGADDDAGVVLPVARSRWRRPSKSAPSSRSAIRSPTARSRRRTPTTAGPITSRGG